MGFKNFASKALFLAGLGTLPACTEVGEVCEIDPVGQDSVVLKYVLSTQADVQNGINAVYGICQDRPEDKVVCVSQRNDSSGNEDTRFGCGSPDVGFLTGEAFKNSDYTECVIGKEEAIVNCN